MNSGEHNPADLVAARILSLRGNAGWQSQVDRLASLSANSLGAPIGFMAFFDSKRFEYLATSGMPPHELPIAESPIIEPSDGSTVFHANDISADARLANRSVARTDRPIQLLAGAYLYFEGHRIGMAGILDHASRSVSESELQQLHAIGKLAESIIELQLKNQAIDQTNAAITAFYQKNPIMSHSIDTSGVIVQVSDRWCQHFGYDRTEVIGRKSIDFLTSASKNYAIEVAFPQLRDAGHCNNLPFQWICKDGQIRDISLSAVNDHDQFGNPVTLAVLTDVTDRVEDQVRMEQQSAELANARERLETAMSGGDVGLWDWSVRDNDVYFSPVWHTQIGEHPGTLHGLEAWQSRVHPDDVDDALQRVQDCFDGDQSEYESIFRFRHANGDYRTILSRGRKFTDERGSPRRLIGIHVDITERQQNEDRLALELKRNLDFLRILENGLRAQSVEELIDWLPIELREMVGTHQSQVSIVRHNDWADAIHNSSLSEKWERYGDTIDPPDFSGEIASVCINQELVMKNEHEIEPYPGWYRDGHSGRKQDLQGGPPLRGWLAVPLLASDGSNLGLLQVSDKLDEEDFGNVDQQVVVQFGYITSLCVERLIAQEEERERSAQLESALRSTEFQAQSLAKTNEELEQFAYVASHDLRSPLRGIAHLTDWITEDTKKAGIELPVSVVEHLEMLDDQVRRMDNLLVGLLAYSRAGHEDFESEPVDLNLLVAETVAMVGLEGNFEIAVPTDMPTIMTKRSPLERIFLNLITNAVKHHDRETGTIEIGFQEQSEKELLFSIEDDGPGIPDEYHGQVFEVYQTLKSSGSESSGMGLSIVKKLVESAGGRIWISETVSQRGTKFIFTWPSGSK